MLALLLFALALAAPLAEAPPCVATVAQLPASPLFAATDTRLQGGAVIVVQKEKRMLQLFEHGRAVDGACYFVGLASGYPAGHKQRRGDMRTPEGWYRTSDKPWSSFYSAIAVHYPAIPDADRGLRAGLIDQAQHDAIVAAIRAGKKPPQDTRLGGEILIHGGGGSSDWTLGCVALDDEDIDELRSHLPAAMKTDVLILP